MIIVVDAYNLLRSVPPYKKTITDKERVQFIAYLSAYGKRKGHKIVIVFDGGPYEWPFKENHKAVTIVYSGIHESADDYIKEYIEIHQAKDLLLVSSDSELNRCAARLNIPSIDSAIFQQLLFQEFQAKQNSSVKESDIVKLIQDEENSSDIDALMKEASKNIPTKSEDMIVMENKRDGNKSQVSKQERSLLKKLRKL